MTAVADLSTTPEGWVAGTWIIDPAHTMARDNHLRSADFFEAGRYPVMSFASTGVRPAGGRGAIRRSDFGITFGLAADGAKIFIGDKVDLVLDVQAYLGG